MKNSALSDQRKIKGASSRVGQELHQALQDFLEYLLLERQYSSNTIDAYRRDLLDYVTEVTSAGIISLRLLAREGPTVFSQLVGRREIAPSTIARKLSSMKSFHRFLRECGRIKNDSISSVRSPKQWKKVPEVLSIYEVERLLSKPDTRNHLGLRDKALLELMYGTGMRESEVIGLKLIALDMKNELVRCLGKGKKERIVPFGSYAKKYLDQYLSSARAIILGKRRSDHVFITSRGKPLTRMAFWKRFSMYAKMAGLRRGVRPHTLRHSCATHMLEGGADLRVVQELLGHSSISTTEIYTAIDSEHLREVHRTFHPRP